MKHKKGIYCSRLLVEPSDFRLNLGGNGRNKRGVKSRKMQEMKKIMTQSFLEACGMRGMVGKFGDKN